MSNRILIADDERTGREALSRFLRLEGFEVDESADGMAALEMFQVNPYDVLITDLKMPKMDGLDLLREVKAISPATMGIVITGYASTSSAIQAMKLGAFDYVSKPYELDEIRLVIKRAIEYQVLQSENVTLKKQLKRKYRFENIIGDSKPMQDVFRLIEKVADSDSTVLIQGDSGTGKELVARAIHYNSNRKERYLIPVNCGAIPETLLESELFGHVKGAFTGATTNRIGRFEAANGGTLFLDEIGDMSPSLQVKVLRVIQEQEFEPVGSNKTRKVDVRIIAATNQDLELRVAERLFREDLYYRLSVIPIHIPALRERTDDIVLLANYFLELFCRQKQRKIKPLSIEVIDAFQTYDWPGNVRELENLIERLVILNEIGEIKLDDLPEKFQRSAVKVMGHTVEIPDDGLDFNTMVNDFENRLILAAMTKARGNKNLAAKLLGLKRTTLVEKIKKKDLDFNTD
ncbi:MAG TPA: sigma-54 dependent transcriptional regulator [bacterium]|nr:sigma-54 dependent transcriptional regulator [bacterium]